MSVLNATVSHVPTAPTSPTYNERPLTVIKTIAQTKTSKKSYPKEGPNARALTQMTAWLKAAAIPVKASKTAGCDLVVTNANGQDVELKVGLSFDDKRPAKDHLFVLACEVTSRHAPTALRAFQSVTVATGYGAPQPVDRGQAPAKKLSYEDNFELVAMRHQEFRKVPNPSKAELAKYDRVINKAISRFMYINSKICKRHLLGFEDLKTYAQVWTCNYLGLYKVANPTNNDNEKKLYAHLCQRFSNFVDVFLKKERNCVPDAETLSIALFGRPVETAKARTARNAALGYEDFDADRPVEEEEELPEADQMDEILEYATVAAMDATIAFMLNPDEPLEDKEEVEAQISDAKRRKMAQAQLKAEFAKLPHDRLIEILTEASENEYLCYDARMEARKQLRLHVKSCEHCEALEVSADEAGE